MGRPDKGKQWTQVKKTVIVSVLRFFPSTQRFPFFIAEQKLWLLHRTNYRPLFFCQQCFTGKGLFCGRENNAYCMSELVLCQESITFSTACLLYFLSQWGCLLRVGKSLACLLFSSHTDLKRVVFPKKIKLDSSKLL